MENRIEKAPAINAKGTKRFSAGKYIVTVIFPKSPKKDVVDVIMKDALNGKCEYGQLPKKRMSLADAEKLIAAL